jgi:dolichol-phosphate mannosyltransferase
MARVERPLIVVPTYNEAENVDELLDGIFEYVPHTHVLFVDDNSADGTPDKVRAHMERRPGKIHMIEREGKLGLGTAYIAGMRWALERDYESVQEMDADLSHDPRYLPQLFDFPEGVHVVIGSRYIPGGGTVNWGIGRKFISGFGNVYARTILGSPIRDLTGGFNNWHRQVLETISLDGIRSEGYAFQIEMKYRAARAGFKAHEVPIVFADRRVGQSKMSGGVAFEAMLRVWGMRFGR